jgi:hypothetical protein
MSGQTHIPNSLLNWLLEADDPAARYITLRDLLKCPPDDTELCAAHAAAHRYGAIPAILDEMQPEGYWVTPGAGYNPKYKSTVWSIILLAQLGACAEQDQRIAQACAYLLDHALTAGGQFTTSGTPSGTADCLQGNLCAALIDLGWNDPRLVRAFDWMARTVTGEGIAPASESQATERYYAGKCGPLFACGANNKLPCAWGAAKVMLALGKCPSEMCTPSIRRAIEAGVDFLFSVDPAGATYPSGYSDKPSGNWWKFGFPVFYVTDVLQIAEVLIALGFGNDPRLTQTIQLIREKQDTEGRWALEYSYRDKTWVTFGENKQPNKWVTLRALRVLDALS